MNWSGIGRVSHHGISWAVAELAGHDPMLKTHRRQGLDPNTGPQVNVASRADAAVSRAGDRRPAYFQLKPRYAGCLCAELVEASPPQVLLEEFRAVP